MPLILNIYAWLSVYLVIYSALMCFFFKQPQERVRSIIFKLLVSFIAVPVLVLIIGNLDIIHKFRHLFGQRIVDVALLPYTVFLSIGKSFFSLLVPKSLVTGIQNKPAGEEIVLAPALIFASAHVYVTVFLTKWLTGKFSAKNIARIISIITIAYSFAIIIAFFMFKLQYKSNF